MSTQTRAAASSAGIKDIIQNWKEALHTPKGKRIYALVQFAVSLISILYLVGIAKLAYYSVFYQLEISEAQRRPFCVQLCFICLFFTIALIFSRKQAITRFAIMFSMPLHLFVFLFNYQYRVFVIPMAIMIILTYLCNGVGEGPKTVLGAVFVMFYIIGAYLYMTAGTMLISKQEKTVVESGVSALGEYRYEIVQVKDKSDGSTYVSLEPNTLDIVKKNYTLKIRGYDKKTYIVRPMTNFKCDWVAVPRSEITKELLEISPEISFALNDKQLATLGVSDSFKAEVPVSETTKAQRQKLGICIAKDLNDDETPESLGLELHDTEDLVTVTFKELRDIPMSVECHIRLADLSDGDLEALGIPDMNDVLYVNGKPVFRQYIAVVENTFSSSNRSFESFLK